MRDLLWRVCFRRKIWPHHVTGDATYGTTENIVAHRGRGHPGLCAADRLRRTGQPSTAGMRSPTTLSATNTAAHKTMSLSASGSSTPKKSSSIGQTPRRAIAARSRPSARPATGGAASTARFYAEYLEKVRGYHATEAYKKAMSKRQVWIEPLFAEAKVWHGLRRLRLRGLLNANIQGLLIAAGQNLKRFLAASGWGQQHAPCRSLLALPREPWRLSAVSG